MKTRVFRWVAIAFLVVVTLVPEYGSELLEAIHVDSRHSRFAWAGVFRSGFWYQPLLRMGGTALHDEHVRLITLTRGKEPDEIFPNVCRQRLFVARLLDRLYEMDVALIVLDKFFKPDTCTSPADRRGTEMLLAALARSPVPVVVGISTSTEDDLQARAELTPKEREALDKVQLVRDPSLEFPDMKKPVRAGLVRLNRDTRKIPLEWTVAASRAALSTGDPPVVLRTLARVAAELRDVRLSSVDKFKYVVEKQVHPYTTFMQARAYPGGTLSADEIPAIAALDLLCGTGFAGDWEHCKSGGEDWSILQHGVAVIGNANDPTDMYDSVIGRVPGVLLQANYIEALLDDRYLKPVPSGWVVALNVGLALFIGFASIVSSSLKTRFTASPLRIALTSFVAGGVLWVLSYLIAMTRGYYIPVLFPWLYVVVVWADSTIEKLRERADARRGAK